MASFVRLNSKTSTLLPETRLLKEDEYLGFQEGHQLLEEARRNAEQTAAQAEQTYEEQKQRGYKAGIEQARQEMAAQMVETVTHAKEYFTEVEAQVVDVVMTSVKKILGEFSDRELTVRLVKNALHVFRSEKEVTVRVPMERESDVSSRLKELTADYPDIARIQVVGDPKLDTGNCILETEIGIVNGGIEAQLQVLEQVFRSRLPQREERDEDQDNHA